MKQKPAEVNVISRTHFFSVANAFAPTSLERDKQFDRWTVDNPKSTNLFQFQFYCE